MVSRVESRQPSRDKPRRNPMDQDVTELDETAKTSLDEPRHDRTGLDRRDMASHVRPGRTMTSLDSRDRTRYDQTGRVET
jgi:hypothetical protein